MVRVRERRARNENHVGSLYRCQHRLDDVVIVGGMTLVVDAAEGQPHGQHAEDLARPSVLVATCTRGLALGPMAGTEIPASCSRLRFRVATEDREQLDLGSTAGGGPHRCAERQDSVVEMRRHHDDVPAEAVQIGGRRHDSTMIATLAGREQESRL